MDEQLNALKHDQQSAIDLAIQFGPKLAAGHYVGRWVLAA
jgi:hypothetical protein